jgi:hypothetical protein
MIKLSGIQGFFFFFLNNDGKDLGRLAVEWRRGAGTRRA